MPFLIFLGMIVLGLVVLIQPARHAPEGQEDEGGFRLGRRPEDTVPLKGTTSFDRDSISSLAAK